MTTGLWVSTDTEEIEGIAAGFDEARRQLDLALLRLRAAAAALRDGGAYPPLVTGAIAAAAIEAARASCEDAVGRVAGRADALRQATRGYDEAESNVLGRLLATPLPGSVVGPFGASPFVLGGAAAGAITGTSVLPGWLAAAFSDSSRMGALGGTLSRVFATPGAAQAEDAVRAVRSAAPGLAAAGPLAGVLDGALGLFSVLDARPNDPVATAEREVPVGPGERSTAPAAAGGVADLADRIGIAYDASGPSDAAVEVQRIDHADGSVSWTVAVPGLQGGVHGAGPDGVPMSWDSTVPAFVGTSTAVDALVISAMASAGIRPGQPVVLAGHSLGGIVATNLALDPAVRERFSVAAVVTYGAPVTHLRAPDVPTMTIQHVEDGVPALSGEVGARPGGPAPGEVIVVRELGSDGERAGLLSEHRIEDYAETARFATESDQPATLAWERDTAGLWAQEGDVVTATTYRGSRAELGAPQNSWLSPIWWPWWL
ncbi:hypothetical protein FH969_06380 [Miniimonas arenae]|uniref:Fungal lipase-like domain-containing protein n=1 Tax=Miniimonas arenae TaxID=676201 RepID=A0A5C5BCB7_9MICO|nr:hypothetical protein [Miniimonas arenae]TNU75044.1 hypothetical protein FH969_06380 [Miniimonas arenae]